jgi:catechol 2,3-dioxygenase-like lactoylglutathione lyase family enzyme
VTGLGEVALFTDDVEGVASFYQRLLGNEPETCWPGGALFAVGHGKLLVHARAGAQAGGPPNEDHFAVSVDDLAAACAEAMGAGLELLIEPREYAWGRSAYLRDPDGRLVELAQA